MIDIRVYNSSDYIKRAGLGSVSTEGILEESEARKKLLLKSCVLRGIIILTGMPSISLPVKSVEIVIICACHFLHTERNHYP